MTTKLITAFMTALAAFNASLRGEVHGASIGALNSEAARLDERASNYPSIGAGSPHHIYKTRANAMKIASNYLTNQ